jgi:HD-like signal output (HDOD) protein
MLKASQRTVIVGLGVRFANPRKQNSSPQGGLPISANDAGPMTSSWSKARVGRVLFVGLDPGSVRDFNRIANSSVGAWSITRAATCAEAGQLLEQEPADVVIAAAQEKQPGCLEFLDYLMVRHPETTRVILVESGATENMLDGVGRAHHYIQTPCDWSTLVLLLNSIASRNWEETFPGLPHLITRLPHLPSLPETYFQLASELQEGDVSVERVGELTAQDPALSAKVLQLANSAVFGLQLRVTHPTEAVLYLGLETIKALLLLAHTFSTFENVPAAQISLLQRHALNVGRFAQGLAVRENTALEVQNEAFTSGLLHDIGKLLLAANIPQEYSWILEQSRLQKRHTAELETEMLGANHAAIGGFILHTWHLPGPIVDAVTWHHFPSRCPEMSSEFSALAAVHVANAAEHQRQPDSADTPQSALDWEFLRGVGFSSAALDQSSFP